jgi:hypothetical protein
MPGGGRGKSMDIEEGGTKVRVPPLKKRKKI